MQIKRGGKKDRKKGLAIVCLLMKNNHLYINALLRMKSYVLATFSFLGSNLSLSKLLHLLYSSHPSSPLTIRKKVNINYLVVKLDKRYSFKHSLKKSSNSDGNIPRISMYLIMSFVLKPMLSHLYLIKFWHYHKSLNLAFHVIGSPLIM